MSPAGAAGTRGAGPDLAARGHNRRMSRSVASAAGALVLAALALLPTACASTPGSVPVAARSLALLDVGYAQGRFERFAVAPGEEAPSSQVGRSLLVHLSRKGRFVVTDGRDLGLRPGDLARDLAKSATLRAEAPADAWLAARLLACGAWPQQANEARGATASSGTVTVYWFAGECTLELDVLDAQGVVLAKLQETGRWDSPRRESPQGRLVQGQATAAAIDDAARLLADRLVPGPPRM